MPDYFAKVKDYLIELDLKVVAENEKEQLVIVDDEENGIKNLVVDCEDPILIIEQLIMPVPTDKGDLYQRLLQMNRSLVHGAFAVDEETKYIIFRDTLQLENLDLNELDGSLKALSLAMAEFGSELLGFARA